MTRGSRARGDGRLRSFLPFRHVDPDPARDDTGPRTCWSYRSCRSWQDAEGRTVYDFGQNAAGYVAFTVKGEAGARVIVEHAEMLDHNGQFDQRKHALGRSADRIRAEGRRRRDAIGRPSPSSASATRAWPSRARREITAIAIVPISSAIAADRRRSPRRIRWSTGWSRTPSGRSARNFIDVPTDCPQRDERLGWTGDAQVFAATACYLHESHGIPAQMAARRDRRPARGWRHRARRARPDAQSSETLSRISTARTGWGDAICVIPWVLSCTTAIASVLDEALPAMAKWVDFVWSISDGPIVRPPRHGARAASPSATGCSRGGPTREAVADHRRRRGGDDLPLHLLEPHGAGRRGRRRRGACPAHARRAAEP